MCSVRSGFKQETCLIAGHQSKRRVHLRAHFPPPQSPARPTSGSADGDAARKCSIHSTLSTASNCEAEDFPIPIMSHKVSFEWLQQSTARRYQPLRLGGCHSSTSSASAVEHRVLIQVGAAALPTRRIRRGSCRLATNATPTNS